MSEILPVSGAVVDSTSSAKCDKKTYVAIYMRGFRAGQARDKEGNKGKHSWNSPYGNFPSEAEYRELVLSRQFNGCGVCGDKLDPEHPVPRDKIGGIVCKECEKALDALDYQIVAAMNILEKGRPKVFKNRPRFLDACLHYLNNAFIDGTVRHRITAQRYHKWYDRYYGPYGRLDIEESFLKDVADYKEEIARYQALCKERGVDPNPEVLAGREKKLADFIEANSHMAHLLKSEQFRQRASKATVITDEELATMSKYELRELKKRAYGRAYNRRNKEHLKEVHRRYREELASSKLVLLDDPDAANKAEAAHEAAENV